jgi:3-hydroxyisobutyrate dehydrogenase-like beta-hydroxyacid dehydrogenase
MMELRAVGLLSPGDMGHVVGHVLIGHGMPVVTCLAGRSERTRVLAQKAGIQAVPTYEDLVRDTDVVLSILVPAEAENAARRVVTALRQASETTVYVDCNAIAPATAERIGGLIAGVGSRFVSASIIGPPPRRTGTTRFYASGTDVEAFEALAEYGLDIRPLGAELGHAKGIKMAYGALTKGVAAIATELLVAARRMGLYTALVAELNVSQAPLYHRIERTLPAMPTKARRWIGEMEEIAATFTALGLTPKTYQGAADMYRFVGHTPLADETPETRDRDRDLAHVIEILAKKNIR